MNKILKRVLITICVIIGVLVSAYALMMMKMKHEMRDFAVMETGKIIENIFVVKDDFSNIFIIRDSAQYIVIDAGNNPSKTAEQMKILDINPDDVSAVLLTHSDMDHVGALSLFGKAKVYMSKEEERMLNGEKFKCWWLPFPNAISRSDYILLKDREVIEIGNLEIESILVPGHTTGMTAYLINDKYLFTGDILSLKDGKIAPIPAFFDMDRAQAVESMEIIRDIPNAEYIFTGHWGFTDDYKSAVER